MKTVHAWMDSMIRFTEVKQCVARNHQTSLGSWPGSSWGNWACSSWRRINLKSPTFRYTEWLHSFPGFACLLVVCGSLWLSLKDAFVLMVPNESPSPLCLQRAARWGLRRAHPQTWLGLILSGRIFLMTNGRKPNLQSLKLLRNWLTVKGGSYQLQGELV